MGFDIECIIDLYSYPGEYFCPVCRTLVYPKEALQTRCTHLYCKSCLVHVANSTKTCPYDGYPVTESESKPLMDSDKELSEKISKVKVRCLYFRSGCAWEGTFSDCTSHCSDCSFGNFPVMCNRCGQQIIHRQIHDHAQSCSGAYEGQQTTLPTASAVVAQTVAPTSQAQVNPQTPNMQVNPGAQPVAAAPTQTQWHQQYYQQYVGYDPYQQQVGQNYYAVQHQPFLQHYQQHHVNVQPQVMPQLQPQAMPQTLPAQPQVQAQAPTAATNYQVQPQQQPPVRLDQTLHPPYSQPIQPQPYAQPLGMRPPGQHPQMLQYQQPHVQMHPQPQAQSYFQPPNQSHLQIQPQAGAYHHTQAQPPVLQPQAQQFATPGLPHPQQTPVPTVTGHQSYPRPQLAPHVQSGAMQQHQLQSNFANGSAQVGNIHGQAPPQQSPLMRPPYSHGSVPHQNASMLQPPQNQVPGISTPHNKQFPSTHPGIPMQPPIQQAAPHQYARQQSSAPFQSQSHHQSHFPPLPPQMPPSAVPQHQQSQNYPVRPTVPNQPVYPQNYALQPGGFGPASNPIPALPVSAQTAMNQDYTKSVVPAIDANVQDPLPSKEIADKGIKGDSENEEAYTIVNQTTAKDTDSAAENVVKDVNVQGQPMQVLYGKSFVDDAMKIEYSKEGGPLLQDSSSFKPINPENLMTSNTDKLHGVAVSGADPGQSLDTREERKPGFLLPPPQSYGSQAVAQAAANQHGVMGKVPRPETTPRDQMSGSVEVSNLLKNYGDKPNLYGVDGGKDLDFNSRDENMKLFARENLNRFPAEPTRDLGKAPFSLRASYVPSLKAGFKSDPLVQSPTFLQPHPTAGHGRANAFEQEPEFGQHHSKHFVHRSPGKEHLGFSPRRFGGPSGYPHDSSAFDDANIRSRPLPGHMLRGDIDIDGPGMRRFYGQGGPSPLKREDYKVPGSFSDHGHSGEFGGPGNLPHGHFGESARGERSVLPHFGEPDMKSSLLSPGFPHARTSTGSTDPFDQSRGRPVSAGWCRICKLDCETVEALDLHSQTREHQNRAMDIVNTMKEENRKRPRTSVGHVGHEGVSKGRKGKNGGRGGRGGRG